MIPSSPDRPSSPSSDPPLDAAQPRTGWAARAYAVLRFVSLVLFESPPLMLGVVIGGMIFLLITPAGDPTFPHAPTTAVSS
jgi:hypothetical protein